MATKRICGFECGVNNNTAHVALGTGASFNTSIFRSGGTFGRSVRVNLSSQNSYTFFPTIAGNTKVARIYIYFATLPSADTLICRTQDAGLGIFYGVGFHQSTGQIRTARSNSGVITFGASGPAVVTGQWYKLDVRVVANGSTIVTDVQVAIPGEAATPAAQLSHSNSFGLLDSLGFGSTANVTADMYFDDAKIADASADYPLNEGSSVPFIPTSDGSHNIAGANQFERGTTGVDITNSTTTAYQLVDELPMDDSVPVTDDYIAAIAPASGSDYVEVKFGPAPGVSIPTDPPEGVELIVGYHRQATSESSNIRLALVDNSTVDDVVNTTTISGTEINFGTKQYQDPPSPASVWALSGGDGNFLNLRVRFYSSDATPDVYFDGALIEADFPVTEPPPPPGGYYACAGTLPSFNTAVQDKIAALRALRAAGSPIGQVFQMVKVDWPTPTGAVYYAVLQVNEVATVAPPVSPIETRLVPEDNPAWFYPQELDASIGDSEVDLVFNDLDGEFSDLLVLHGEGRKVEIMYWFPSVALLLTTWHGHLRKDKTDIERCSVKAIQGFRSSEGLLPSRAHWRECQAPFGALFDTQAQIDEHDCPYNRHIGGAVGNLNGGVPFTSCPRRTVADCNTRLGSSGLFMLSHATQSVTVANNQTKGQRLFSTSNGNETNLKDPVVAILGNRRVHGMAILASRKDFNNNEPDKGFIFIIAEVGEGPVDEIKFPIVNLGDGEQPADPANFSYRLGTKGQTPVDTALTTHGYSSTALIRARSGWVNPDNVDISQISASVIVHGINNCRIYTDATTYTEDLTSNRAWHIMRMLTDKRWGYGYEYDQLDIPAFIEAACWCDNVVRFTDANGDNHDHIRARSDIELRGRKVQQQIEDICMAGRLSRPFLFNGKIHIVPLRELTAAELAAAPVFTDEGNNRNIVQEEIEDNVFKSTLEWSEISDIELPNRIECTFDDAGDNHLERPLRPIEDIDAQIAAGGSSVFRKINVKKYGLAGVVVETQALKIATSLLDLGPFDEGGLANNLELKFRAWFLDCLDLYPTKVIKVQSSKLTKYDFDYFRIKEIKPLANLEYDLTVQAYNETYMASFEELYGGIDPIPSDPPVPPGGSVAPPTDPLVFGSITYVGGVLQIPNFATV